MNKEKLNGFIDRYSLGGEIESVKLVSNNEALSVGVISDDKVLRGEVSVKDDKFPTGEFGVYTTSQLQRMLGVLESNIDVDVMVEDDKPTSLLFSGDGTKVQYMLAEPKVIPKVPDVKRLPEFNIKVKLDTEFIDTFSKSLKALKDVSVFTFLMEDDEPRIVLGYSSINSNRISVNVGADVDGDISPISFNADYLDAILNCNKGSESSSMEISTDGLCRLRFTDGEFECEYYLVESK